MVGSVGGHAAAPAPAGARADSALAQAPGTAATTVPPDSALAPIRAADPRLARPALDFVAVGLGLENVTLDTVAGTPHLAYENRRFRHSADAYGWLERGGDPFVAYERRLGLTSAMIRRHGPLDRPRFHVLYPSDRGFQAPPRGRRLRPTSRTVDLSLGVLVAYDLGRIEIPAQFQVQTEATLRYNPWPGGLATASMLFPNYNDFLPDARHPDADNIRPGLLTFDQYAWIPRVALASGSAGVFADNRYGVSFGVARPLFGGALLLDAQADLTGFIAFNTDAIHYSSMSQASRFGGITWRPPLFDLAVRARYAQFLYGDHGGELQVTRSFGDFDIAFSVLRSNEVTVEAVRLILPVPPLTRPARTAVRVLPVERFPIGFRTDATPVGTYLIGAASREGLLRQLSVPSMESNGYRVPRAMGRDPRPEAREPILWVNHSGTTGFVNTPWAGVQPERHFEVGFTSVPRKWAYNPKGIPRGVYRNEIYYASLGLLPRLEVGLRITRIPGFNAVSDIDPESQLSTDTDHMASFRLAVLEPRERRPGLAVGVEDVDGTRRYHSAYLVAGLPFSIFRVQNRFSLGYASTVFTASRYVLDGTFGAIEVSPWRGVAARFEHDTEKFNVGLGVELGFGLRIRAAALKMESVSVGAGWHHKL